MVAHGPTLLRKPGKVKTFVNTAPDFAIRVSTTFGEAAPPSDLTCWTIAKVGADNFARPGPRQVFGETLGRCVTLEQVSEALVRDQPTAMTQRHRPHIGRPDTFEKEGKGRDWSTIFRAYGVCWGRWWAQACKRLRLGKV